MKNEDIGINLIFDGSPGPDGPRFIEAENDQGQSIGIGSWTQESDGTWALRITPIDFVNLPGFHADHAETELRETTPHPRPTAGSGLTNQALRRR